MTTDDRPDNRPRASAPDPSPRNARHPSSTVEENVAVAESLAGMHFGFLPAEHWMRSNGYEALAACMSERPGAFAHLRRAASAAHAPLEQRVHLLWPDTIRHNDGQVVAAVGTGSGQHGPWLRIAGAGFI